MLISRNRPRRLNACYVNRKNRDRFIKIRSASNVEVTSNTIFVSAVAIILRRNFQKHGIQITPPPKLGKELICCDLSVGKLYREPGKAEPFDLTEHQLRPGECMVVQTREEFTVPDGVFGMLCSKGSLTEKGIMVPNTKVDPMFGGPLYISVYNASRRPVLIKQGMSFCSIVFHLLEEPTNSKDYRRAPDISGRKMGFFEDLWDRHAANSCATLRRKWAFHHSMQPLRISNPQATEPSSSRLEQRFWPARSKN